MPNPIPDLCAELERFKTRINLTEYAAHLGYQLDRKESSRHSVVMRGADGDKVVIARDARDGHWLYFSVRDEADNGTVIDFAQRRQGLNLGALRKQLRPWIGEGGVTPTRPSVERYVATVEPSSADRTRVAAAYAATEPMDGQQAYLEGTRQIPAAVLAAPRFAGKIRVDGRGNAVFPHHDADGLCGFEKKNQNFTGFASGGSKGVWVSASNSRDHTLVITEGAIDALSYYALFDPPRARYLSIGGAMNPGQPDLLRRAMRRMPEGGKLIIATDNDAGGDRLAEQIGQLARESRPDLAVTCHRPPAHGQDWNDVLKTRPRLPSAGQGRGV